MAAVAEMFQEAWQQHQAGSLSEAEQLYRQIIALDPAHVDAMAFLGAVCQARGDQAQAEAHYRRALRLWPGHMIAQNGLGILLAQQGKLEEAAELFQQLTTLQPRHAEAHNNLGLVRATQGRLEEAVACYQRAIELQPEFANARDNLNQILQHHNLAVQAPSPSAVTQIGQDVVAAVQTLMAQSNAQIQQGNLQEAKRLLEKAEQLYPNSSDVQTNLGHIFLRLHRRDEAIVCYEKALRIYPDNFEAHYIFGIVLHEKGDLAGAEMHYLQANRLRPNVAELANNLGSALLSQGRFDEALEWCRKAVELNPNFADGFANLGCIYLRLAQPDEAMSQLRQALRLQPNMSIARSNYLCCLTYDPNADPDDVFAEHRRWAELHATKAPIAAHANDRDHDRRLRIGYVSPDFRNHALLSYFEPVLASHDPSRVEVFCYSDVAHPDAGTARAQKLANHWRVTRPMSAEQLAEQIRNDRIDILVDLAGHTADNRLLMFAQKPAPVQVTWLGYLNTTGLKAIDYRLTDAVMDPPSQTVRDAEEPFRLPGGFCCFNRSADTPPVSPLPALRGFVTFGSLNNSTKFNTAVYDLWCRVLRAVPDSRMLMFRDTLTASARENLRRQFAQRGVDAKRLDLRQWSGNAGFQAVYNEIDISLDTFPCTGGVTTCESLWMGVPVISLCGVRPAGRHSASHLSRVGLADWAVNTPEEYVTLALRMARDLEGLAKIRAELRGRMEATICDARRLTRELEEAYRTIWRRWCAKQACD